jgi:glycosyltransferase involved in cell wall biosynthesis
VEGKSGLFYNKPTVDDLADAIQRFESSDYFASRDCASNCLCRAEKFSKENFKREFKEFAEEAVLK